MPVAHDRDHPLDLGAQLGAELGDRRGPALQHRVAELDDLGERGVAPLQQLARRAPALALVLARLARSRSSLIAQIVCDRSSGSAALTADRRRRRSRRRAARGRRRAARPPRATAATVASRSSALISSRRRWRLRTRNIGAGPSSSVSRGQRLGAARAAERRAAPRRAAAPPRRRGRSGPGARRAGSAARGGARAPRRGSRRSRGGRRGRCSARSGARVCTITSPPASPRPLRPASWATIAKVRSSARKSGKRRVASASRIALRVTSGKSWPLATIWVPTRTPLARLAEARRGCGRGRRAPAAVSESRRKTGIGASRSREQRLDPLGAGARRARAWSSRTRGQARGSGSAWAQWWQTRRPLWRWTISETSQLGQPQWCPQERQVSQGAKPRRLISTIALPPARADLLQRLPGRRRAAGPSAGRPRACRRTSTGGIAAAVDAPRQLQPRQLEPGLRAAASRCRRRAPRRSRAARLAGDRAGVVAGVALLLVGGVVLLVDHDQAEVADRGEDGRARADADARPRRCAGAATRRSARPAERAECRTAKRSPSRARKRATACGVRPISGTSTIAPRPAGQRRLDRGQVDLGLARAGDAVQEQLARRAGLAVERGDDRADGRARCSAQQLRRGAAGAATGVAGRPAHARELRVAISPRPSRRRSVGAVGADRGGQLGADMLARARAPPAPPRCRAPSRSAAGAAPPRRPAVISARSSVFGAHRAAARPGPGRQHQLRARARGRAVLAGDPEAEPDQLRRGARLERLERLGEPLRRQLGGLGHLDDDAEDPPRPERDPEDAADPDPAIAAGRR